MEAGVIAYTTIAVLLAYFVFLRKKAHSSVTITNKDGETVRRNARHPELISSIDNVTTLYESWTRAVKKRPDGKCLGTRAVKKGTRGHKDAEYGEYQWASYAHTKERVDSFASGLAHLGASRGDRIGIFSKNREEWIITQLACYTQSLCIVSFYETLGKDSIRYVARHSEIRLAVCSADVLDTLLQVCEGPHGYEGLKHIIVMENVSDALWEKAEKVGVKLITFLQVEQNGQKKHVPAQPPAPTDLCTIMYTSGTTGDPKGVPLTHANIAASIAGMSSLVPVTKDEVYLSYLPFAHIFERVIVAMVIHHCAAVGFFHGDTLGLLEDLKELKPTVMCGVPRVYDRVMQGIQKKVDAKPFHIRALFKSVFAIKAFIVKHVPLLDLPIPVLDKVLFGEIRKALGGNTWLLVSAGAPLSLEVETFLRVCFGCSVSQAYGLTETSGACDVKMPDDPTVGHLGAPLPINEFKLVDLPDMGYTGNRGELCVRGYNVTSGYYKDVEKTKEVFINGWFHTGDIGEFTANGSLKIIDRKKNIFKLAQGEYVAAEKIEGKLSDHNDLIHQIFVYGDSQKSTLVAVVVPNKKELLKVCKQSGDYSAVCASKEAREAVLNNIKEKGKAAGLHGFEIPFAVMLFDHEEGFTVENDMLTPTMKPKRQQIQKTFQKQIDALYNGQDPSQVGGSSSKTGRR